MTDEPSTRSAATPTDHVDPADDADRDAQAESGELERLLVVLDDVEARVRTLYEPPAGDGPQNGDPEPGSTTAAGTGGTAGTGPAESENRVIHRTRSVLAQRDASRLGSELETVQDRIRDAVERAHRSRTASQERRRRRAGSPDRSDDAVEIPGDLGALLERAAQRLLLTDRDQQDPESIDRVLGLVVDTAVDTVPGVERAGITLLDGDGTISSRAPSDVVVAELDALQNTLGEGPCHDAVVEHGHVLIADLDAEEARWPRFVPMARERGVGTMLAFRLFAADDGTAGALNLYAGRPGVFDRAGVETGRLFATHAALTLHGARQASNLTRALGTRDVIGQSKGILMERFGMSAQQAFRLLVESSQTTNLKLRDVAEWTVRETDRKNGHADGS